LLHVLIVGCGNMGGRFDENMNISSPPVTHAGAYKNDGHFYVQGCVDVDDKRRYEFKNFWEIPDEGKTIQELLKRKKQYDLVSICTPTALHGKDLEDVLEFNPMAVFCEKPMTSSVADSKKLMNLYEKRGVLLAINYSRRWDPSIIQLKEIINSESFGKLCCVSAVYNGGILNNGSHMLDLFICLFGELHIEKVGPTMGNSNDLTIPFWLQTSSGIMLQVSCSSNNDYSLFEIQFIFSCGVLSMETGGLYWRKREATESNQFSGYKTAEKEERIPGKYLNSMALAIDNIYRSIKHGDLLLSDARSSIRTQKLCEDIISRSKITS